MLTGVAVGFYNYPSWGVADSQVEDFSRLDECVEGLHQFWDLGCVVPAVDEVLCCVNGHCRVIRVLLRSWVVPADSVKCFK